MAVPAIVVNGKKITMPKPRIKLWREMIKLTERQQSGELQGDEVLDEMVNLTVIAFGNQDVTKEVIEEQIGLDELVLIFEYIKEQITGVVASKSAQFPNVKTPAGT